MTKFNENPMTMLERFHHDVSPTLRYVGRDR